MTLSTNGLRTERPRPKWQCGCGTQCTRREVIDGKKIVICRRCSDALRARR